MIQKGIRDHRDAECQNNQVLVGNGRMSHPYPTKSGHLKNTGRSRSGVCKRAKWLAHSFQKKQAETRNP